MKKSAQILCLVLLLSLTCVQCGRGPGPEEAAVDSPAPPFQLNDLYGREVSLSQFQGKVVILDFWATWCGPCRMSMPLLEKLQQEFPAEMKLLAINLEEPEDLVKDYVSRQNIHSTVLLDTEGKVGRAYRSESIPMQVIIDKKGIVRDVMMGFSPQMLTRLREKIVELRSN